MSLTAEVKRALTDKITDTVFDEPMSRHTSFHIGGPAAALLQPSSTEEIKAAIAVCKRFGISYFIMGNGTNLLVSGRGLQRRCDKAAKNMETVRIDGCTIETGAGVLLSKLASAALKASLSGFERLGGFRARSAAPCI